MVLGRAIAVTAVAPMNQCAEITRKARGFGSCKPIERHASVKPFTSNVFIGLPWPINKAGIVIMAGLYHSLIRQAHERRWCFSGAPFGMVCWVFPSVCRIDPPVANFGIG